MTTARASVAKINTLMDGLQRGEGTAGKFLKDPALYDERAKSHRRPAQTIAGRLNDRQR